MIMRLAAEIKGLSNLADIGRLGPEKIKRTTFTASNIGSTVVCTPNPVSVRPMLAILGVGKVAEVSIFRMDDHENEQIGKGEKVILS